MKSLFELIPLIPVILVYVYIVNWYEEIRPGIYWQFVQLFLLGTLAFQSMAHMFALLSRGSTSILLFITVTTFMSFILLSNFLLAHARLHYIYQFVSNFAVSRFMFEAALLLVYGFGRCREGREVNLLLYDNLLRDEDFTHCIRMLLLNIVLYKAVAMYLLIRSANPVENRRKRVARIEKYVETLKTAKIGVSAL